mgnify:CR=1 FL=1
MANRIASTGLHTLGTIMWEGSGILLFIFWMGTMIEWLGFLLGCFLGFILSPGLVIFPLLYWFVEGVFIWHYFAIWGVGILGGIIAKFSE